jgi:uncharacterized protein (TIGR00269 family)
MKKKIAQKCTKCGGKAVLFRDYEGRALCKKHFLLSIEKRVKRVIRQYKMIGPNDRIGVALSGGVDSSTVLHILNMIAGPRRDAELVGIYIDEGTVAKSAECRRAAENSAKKQGIEMHQFSFKQELGKTLGAKANELKIEKDEVCGLCGITKRWLLNKKARELGLTKLCIGTNLKDEAENIMMNYVRGDIPRASRLGPVTNESTKKRGGESFIPRIKPLRWVPEDEVRLYAKLKGLPFCERKCCYRGGLRADVERTLETLEKRHIGTMFTVVNTFDRMLPGIRKSASYQEPKIIKCKRCGEPGSHDICKACGVWG